MNNHKETSNPGHRTLLSRIQNPALVLASILLTLLALETVARVYVSIRWTEQEVADLTQDYNARDGYISDPEVGYRLEPDRSRTDDQGRVFTHNSLGLRGPETSTIELALASKDSSRSEGFRKNLQEVIAIAQDNEIAVVLASIPLQVEKLVSGVFPGEPEILPYLNTVVKANNQITREVATMHALPFCRWSKPCTT